MKKLILLSVMIALFGFKSQAQLSKTVECTPGNLGTLLPSAELRTYESLTIKGTMDARDLMTLSKNGNYLKSLDLSEVNIAAYSDGDIVYPANTITKSTFSGDRLAVIKLPPTVTSIEMHAFYGCSSLISIDLPASLTSIGKGSFSYCKSLLATTVPPLVTTIDSLAFVGCSALASVVIPSSVTSIDPTAFLSSNPSFDVDENNLSFSSEAGVLFNKAKTKILNYPFLKTGDYTIPSSVNSIGNFAFYNCSGLTSITIPNSVTSIGRYAFYNCNALNSVTIPPSVTTIERDAFSGCSGLTTLTIPSSITTIDRAVFGGCVKLTSVTIPSSVTKIGPYAFGGCTFTSITIPNSVTSIEEGAFNYCSGLTVIYIPASVTSIGAKAFANCASLTSANISSSVTSIGDNAFNGCVRLTSVELPSSVKSIGAGAFADCLNLTAIKIPSSVTTINDNTFLHCTKLVSVELPASAKAIGKSAFRNCESLKSIEIPASATSIGDEAFSGCISLTSASIPSTLTSIGYKSFAYCNKLVSAKIPSSIISIGENAFLGCRLLTTVDVPSSIQSLGYHTFFGCNGITSVYSFLTKSFEPLSVFNSIKTTAVFYVPQGSLDQYTGGLWTGYKVVEMSLNLSKTKANFPGQGDTIAVKVTSTNKWTASADADWLNINTLDSTITFSALENLTGVDRTATIIVSSPGTDDKKITVTQSAEATGINKFNNSVTSVYPNPAAKTLFVNGPNQGLKVSVFDLKGKTLLKTKINDNRINIGSLPNGIYLIRIENGAKTWIDKFVKQ